MRWRRWAIWIAAGLAVPLGLALALLAVDVLRVPRDIAADDVRFQAAPRIRRDLWDSAGFLPGTPGVRLLGAGDDVASRKAIALFALIDPARVQIRTPEQEAIRGRAQLEVTLRARDGGSARLHSRHLNLLGVLTMARYSTSGPESTRSSPAPSARSRPRSRSTRRTSTRRRTSRSCCGGRRR